MEVRIHCQKSHPLSSPSSSRSDGGKTVPMPAFATDNSALGECRIFFSEKSPPFMGNSPTLWPEQAVTVAVPQPREENQGSPTVVSRAIQRLRFIDQVRTGRMGWKDIEQQFDGLAFPGSDQVPVVRHSDFGYCIGIQENMKFTEELLGALRGRREQHGEIEISKHELHNYWSRITNPNFSSRIGLFFDLCDKNMDGEISEMEIKQIILLSASANRLSITPEEVEGYASLIMEEFDCENKGHIQLSQLERFIKKGLRKRVPKGEISTKLTGNCSDKSSGISTWMLAEIWLRTHWRRIWIIGCWLMVCASLFAWKFMQYRRRSAFEVMGFCLCTAKGAAETLKLNMALVLLPVCRNTVTWARKNRRINSIIPFNDNINFHKLIAGGIVVGIILHGGTHLSCDFPRIAGANKSLFRRTIGVDFEHHQPSYFQILATTEAATGISMVIFMAIAFTLATSSPRRNSSALSWPLNKVTGFNTFWYSHHLFVIVYILLVIHSMFLFLTKEVEEKTTWMYIAIPVLLYCTERIVRAIRANFYNVNVIKAMIYPGKVLSLKLCKPAGFQFRSGMYIFLQCPQISPFEWHPFSLTSAPDDDHISVHIRALGDWSYQIYSLFQESLVSGGRCFPKINIDGPYGAAAQDHVKYDIVLLVGLGIGATPFISVLKHIVHTLQKAIDDEGESSISKGPAKAYFYWVTREQSSFDWFRDVMKEVSHINKKKAVIEMHNYLTCVQEGDARSTLIAAIQSMHPGVRSGLEIVSKIPVCIHFARPNWYSVFSNLANRHNGERIGVFYCGPPGLAKELKSLCQKVSTKTTRFVFHKENY